MAVSFGGLAVASVSLVVAVWARVGARKAHRFAQAAHSPFLRLQFVEHRSGDPVLRVENSGRGHAQEVELLVKAEISGDSVPSASEDASMLIRDLPGIDEVGRISSHSFWIQIVSSFDERAGVLTVGVIHELWEETMPPPVDRTPLNIALRMPDPPGQLELLLEVEARGVSPERMEVHALPAKACVHLLIDPTGPNGTRHRAC